MAFELKPKQIALFVGVVALIAALLSIEGCQDVDELLAPGEHNLKELVTVDSASAPYLGKAYVYTHIQTSGKMGFVVGVPHWSSQTAHVSSHGPGPERNYIVEVDVRGDEAELGSTADGLLLSVTDLDPGAFDSIVVVILKNGTNEGGGTEVVVADADNDTSMPPNGPIPMFRAEAPSTDPDAPLVALGFVAIPEDGQLTSTQVSPYRWEVNVEGGDEMPDAAMVAYTFNEVQVGSTYRVQFKRDGVLARSFSLVR
ncbi:MAG: hypothetical protein IPN85_00385 [Flavobacteriales bacterium]|nr:hypothetical protein [Flavobacteriales bacterium]MBK9286353.1 hypothetical protein [Flavobacteriales bacterium]MBL0034723.1 hypothetical protein [Flavobacteriales bacterium]